jgi:hypothetical protein
LPAGRTTGELHQWYGRFGFLKDEPPADHITRVPRINLPEKQRLKALSAARAALHVPP